MYDKYIGYIKKDKYPKNLVSNYKVKVLKANIFKEPKITKKPKECLPFSSEINVSDTKSIFFRFDKNKWIK